MKKRILSLVTAIIMALSLCAIAGAVSDHTIPGEGQIGATGDLSTLVKVTLPADFVWFIDEASYKNADDTQVYSDTYNITNESQRATLEITLVSFEQTDATDMTPLTLNLTDDLREESLGADIVGLTGGATPYAQKMTPGQSWDFGFNGRYEAELPLNVILRPQYAMTLNFNVISYSNS